MKFVFTDKKVNLPGKVHAYAEKKVGKLDRYFKADAEAAIVFSVEKDRNQVEVTAAEGDGPVNALDLALRKALLVFYPQVERMRLRDFKVRVIDSGGTASVVRVLIESTDGSHVWTTTGVSSNIIQACLAALEDSLTYFLTFVA